MELLGWEEYFRIYPFTQDREDFRNARLLEAINNHVQGKGFKDKDWRYFIPDYLEIGIRPTPEQEQIDGEEAFTSAYEEALRRAKQG